MQAKSIKGKSITELKSALAKTITADFKPTLAVVFSSVSQDLKGICDPDNERLFVEFTCNLPLQMQREKGDPVMRSGLVIDWTDRSVYTNGSVPEGSKVRFSLPPDWDVMEKVVKGVEQLKNDRMPQADAPVIFSCAGRIISLGPLMSEELEGVKNVWKAPMAGMFSYGELGRATGGNLEMHNLTTCCVAIKEK